MGQPQEYQNPTRKVINTLEDQHKYEMPSARRLGVYMDPKSAYVDPALTDASKLADALSQVNSKVRTVMMEKATNEVENEMRVGMLARMGVDAANPKNLEEQANALGTSYQRQGFNRLDGLLDATTAIERMQADYAAEKPDNIDTWFSQWWSKNTTGKNDEDYLKTFTPTVTKGAVELSTLHAKMNIEAANSERNAKITKLLVDDFTAAKGKPSVAMLETRYGDIQSLFVDQATGTPLVSKKALDDLSFEAAKNYAIQTGNVDVFDVFKESKSDGTPGLFYKKGKAEEIEKIKGAILSEKVRVMDGKDKLAREQREDARHDAIGSILDKIDAGDDTWRNDLIGLRKDGKLDASEYAQWFSTLTSTEAKTEKPGQQKAATEMLLKVNQGRASEKDILDAAIRGEYNMAAARSLMGEARTVRTEARKAAREGSDSMRIYKHSLFSQGEQIIGKYVKGTKDIVDAGFTGRGTFDNDLQASALLEYTRKAKDAKPDDLIDLAESIGKKYNGIQKNIKQGETLTDIPATVAPFYVDLRKYRKPDGLDREAIRANSANMTAAQLQAAREWDQFIRSKGKQ